MRISQLQLIDFRNYVNADLSFEPGPTVLVGANGQGKTNVLEAVGYLGTLSSHRVSSDAPLIRRGTERAVLRARAEQQDRALTIELEITAGRANRARLNKAPVTRARDVIGLIRHVLFAPEDLAIVKGDPSDRRALLDTLLVQRFPRFVSVRSDVDRVLRQRNALLKTAGLARRSGGRADLSTLDVWDTHLVEHASELISGRVELIAALRPYFQASYAAISGDADQVDLAYRSSLIGADREDDDDTDEPVTSLEGRDRAEIAELMTARLAEVRPKEIDRSLTLIGPHRDDLVLTIDDFPAKGYASHGQSWSIALALRLASFDLLAAEGAEPILMLDDVFAELDARRRAHLADLAQRAEQTLITAAVLEDIPPPLRSPRITVEAGTVSATDGG